MLFTCLSIVSSYGVRFAVIGDYGTQSDGAVHVSSLVKSWDPECIITTGDNNYPFGERETIDQNVGRLYSPYIFPYTGEFEQPTVLSNRFWPCLGNHDFGKKSDKNADASPYFDYFPALKGQHYYDFIQGDVHFFSVCSDPRCPGGICPDSPQSLWLEETIKKSQQSWKIVYFHHPSYSSRIKSPGGGKWPPEVFERNQERKIDLPFSEWGVSAVLSGHLHLYERFDINGVPYIINGLGGDESFYSFDDTDSDPESKIRFSRKNGALFVEANDTKMSFEFRTISGDLIDQFSLKK